MAVMLAVGRRVVELEHAVTLETREPCDNISRDQRLPPDEMRIRDSVIKGNDEFALHESPQGQPFLQVTFLVLTPEGSVGAIDSLVELRPVTRIDAIP